MGCHKLDISEQKFTTLKVVHKSLWHSVNTCAGAYLFGFNGKEKDDEWTGVTGSHLDFGNRVYDSRIGRFLSIDPDWKAYPYWSPYLFAANNPIKFMDILGRGPGDGTKKKYVTRAQIGVTSSGAIQYKYFAKYYWENITPEQARKLRRVATTPNGWFEVTQEEYVELHGSPGRVNPQGTTVGARKANPDAFTYSTYGADTPKKFGKLGDVQGSIFGQSADLVDAKEGVFEITTSGQDVEGNIITESFEFSVLDKEGNIVSTQTQQITGQGTITFDYKIGADESILINRLQGDSGGATSYTSGVYTKEKKGERAPDTMSQYGTEEPVQGEDY